MKAIDLNKILESHKEWVSDNDRGAATIADVIGEDFFGKTMEWLDAEQREVSDEREQEGKSGTD